MKKTVIAAALASTVFSGAAMAWTANGTGGNIELGGNIQVTPYDVPWEVEVGAPATTLDANITKGTSVVVIPVTKAIPVLGIRAKTHDSFNGRPGINPQISYGGAVNLDTFVRGVASMSLPVMDADNPATQIGAMETKFSAAAITSWYQDNVNKNQYSVYSDKAGQSYWGGLAKNAAGVVAGNEVAGMLNSISSQYMTNYNTNSVVTYASPSPVKYEVASNFLSGAYGAGIQAGQNIKLTLTKAAANDVIKWKASLPVTISYQ